MEDNTLNNKSTDAQENSEQEIDLVELAGKLWSGRRRLLRWTAVGIVVGLIVAFSIPKEYVTEIRLAPEQKSSAGGAGLGMLASFAGVNLSQGSSDVVSPNLYPDIVSSVPFELPLLDVRLHNGDDTESWTVAEYLQKEISAPWWSYIMGAPGRLLGLFRGNGDKSEEGGETDMFRLSPEQHALLGALKSRISAEYDSKGGLVTISAMLQDPTASAMLADTVASRLQQYVIAYRTNKARADLEYAEKLNEEARQDYYAAQERYARYSDRNQNQVLKSAQAEIVRLQNEQTLAFELYNQTAQQVQVYRAKVQETTPVFTVFEPATVPIRAAKPSKMIILVGFAFIAFVAACAWTLFGEGIRSVAREIRD